MTHQNKLKALDIIKLFLNISLLIYGIPIQCVFSVDEC